ncbi:hypothetical protein ARALYDRAFT_903310 [Arabidopsis lyrata subsp. lyrata]|uniref:Uncharacterized protein n=1 Tax=Arabidopsis lyrata subsp. lyrata TaxID=81972 RepID=D7LEI2_ARALL|nr:hypothetical protein ARALYDRAFT_903310 [Arabidopsis lyrata subsp. lyrata]
MPDWPSNDDKLQFYEVNESELRDNEWLHLYAEVALFSEWESDMVRILKAYRYVSLGHSFLKSSNAIFYMSFKVREGPDCRGIIRKTSDGRTGHMRLEARCWIDK